jgi:hypothetical protein
MPPADSASRAGVMPKAGGDPSSRTFAKNMKRILIVAAPCVLVALLFIFGPMAIRYCYAMATSSSDMSKMIEEYRFLDRKESSLSGDLLKHSQMRRAQIYDWLLTRGKDIDGGDGERTLLSPWKDLIRYWQDSRADDFSRKK